MDTPTGSGIIQIVDWVELKRGLTRAEFVQRYPAPFLVRKAHRPPPPPAGDEPPTAPARVGSRTELMDASRPGKSPARLPAVLVLPLVKAPGNPAGQISLGRASSCDIVVPDESVSKLHAYFRIVGPGQAEVTDAGSSNRTLVNASMVEDSVTARVRSGDTLIFGRVALQFLDAAATFDLI